MGTFINLLSLHQANVTLCLFDSLAAWIHTSPDHAIKVHAVTDRVRRVQMYDSQYAAVGTSPHSCPDTDRVEVHMLYAVREQGQRPASVFILQRVALILNVFLFPLNGIRLY